MTNKRKTERTDYRDIDDIIDKVIKPRLNKECQKLGIPSSFIHDVAAIYPKPFEFHSICQPVRGDGTYVESEEEEVAKVKIRIDSTIRRHSAALIAFWHEMYHAKQYYEGKKRQSELRATLYSWKRFLEELIHPQAPPQV